MPCHGTVCGVLGAAAGGGGGRGRGPKKEKKQKQQRRSFIYVHLYFLPARPRTNPLRVVRRESKASKQASEQAPKFDAKVKALGGAETRGREQKKHCGKGGCITYKYDEKVLLLIGGGRGQRSETRDGVRCSSRRRSSRQAGAARQAGSKCACKCVSLYFSGVTKLAVLVTGAAWSSDRPHCTCLSEFLGAGNGRAKREREREQEHQEQQQQ